MSKYRITFEVYIDNLKKEWVPVERLVYDLYLAG